tara:strand:+ start:5709 stop:5933 length:225 start_codon:yes stop_codon:yes gene_type:complete
VGNRATPFPKEDSMFLMFLTFMAMLAGMAALVWAGCQRVALHLRDKPEATRAVVEHVLMPLLGRTRIPGKGDES